MGCIFRYLPILLISLFFNLTFANAEMASGNYKIASPTDDSNGESKSSPNFLLLDATGQSSPPGESNSAGYILNSGFIYTIGSTRPLDKVITSAINGLIKIRSDLLVLWNQALTPKEKLAIDRQIKLIENAIDALRKALDAFARYQAGQLTELANALNQSARAIRNMIDFQNMTTFNFNTSPYQKMLAEAAQLQVTVEINRIASIAGANNPNVLSAKNWMAQGSAALLAGAFLDAVELFKKAYNDALAAL